MTKQERNDIILQALQEELQEQPYAKEVLERKFEAWVQSLIAQGNQLLVGQGQPPVSQESENSPAPPGGTEAPASNGEKSLKEGMNE